MRYPVHLKKAKEGGYVVTFFDIPEAITQGETVEDALHRAQDALESAMEFYFEDRRPVPAPSKVNPGSTSSNYRPASPRRFFC
jgi:antitoxin HicB